MRVAMRMWASVLTAVLCVLAGPPVVAGQQNPVTASDGWIRLPAAGETTTVAFASVENPGMYAVYLVSATSDVGKVEFRDASKGPQKLENVTVAAYDTTYMDQKGIHMHVSDFTRPLKEGDTVSIILMTELGVQVEVSALVKKE